MSSGYVECTVDACGWGGAAINGGDDCDDRDLNNYPTNPEVCDGQDNNCDTVADNDLTFTTYYQDSDSDLYDNAAVSQSTCLGWSMSNRITKKLVIDALQMAVWRRRSEDGLIFHSDRDSQYCSNVFQKLLKKYGIISSMSRKDD